MELELRDVTTALREWRETDDRDSGAAAFGLEAGGTMPPIDRFEPWAASNRGSQGGGVA